MLAALFYVIISVIYFYEALAQYDCLGKTTKPCKSCRYEQFSPTVRVPLFQTNNITDCVDRKVSFLKRTIVVTSQDTCSDCLSQGGIQKLYLSLIDALAGESSIASEYRGAEIRILLHGDKDHFILEEDFKRNNFFSAPQFFRRTNVSFEMQPLYCSELNIASCFSSATKISRISMKTGAFEIYNAGKFSLKNIEISAIDAHITTTDTCKNSKLYNCCPSPENPSSPSYCSFSQKNIQYSTSGLQKQWSLFNIEMLFDEGTVTPEFQLENITFSGFFLVNDKVTVTLIKIKQSPSKIKFLNVIIKDSFLVNGFISYDQSLVDNDYLYNGLNIDTLGTTSPINLLLKSTITIKSTLIANYNKLSIKNDALGSLSFINLSGYLGGFLSDSCSVLNFTANHAQYSFILITDASSCYISNTGFTKYEYGLILVLENLLESMGIITNTTFSDCSFLNQYSLKIASSKINITGMKYSSSISTAVGSSQPLLFSDEMSEVYISGLDIINIPEGRLSFRNSKANIISSKFINIQLQSSLITSSDSDLIVRDSLFEGLSGGIYCIDQTRKSLKINNSIFRTISVLSVLNCIDIEEHLITGCLFTGMPFMENFWAPSRFYRNWTVVDTIFSNGNFSSFTSSYPLGQTGSVLRFERSLFINLYLDVFLMEVCCTNFILKDSTMEMLVVGRSAGKGLMSIDYCETYMTNNIINNAAYFGFPTGNLHLYGSYYPVLLSAWVGNFYLRGLKILLSGDFNAPEGVFTCTNSFISDLDGIFMIVFNKSNELQSRTFNVYSVTLIKVTNSTFINLGCVDKSFNLPFLMSEAVASFINYPEEGGETNNRIPFIFIGNVFKNCSCERAGPLAVINFNLMTIKDCYFENTSALDYGGALMVVSTNEFLFDNCTFVGARADLGSFLYLLDIGNISISNCKLSSGRSFISSGIHIRRISSLTIENITVFGSDSVGSGALFNVEEANIIIKNAAIFNLSTSKSGGFLFATFGVNIKMDNISVNNVSSQSGGFLFIQQCQNLSMKTVKIAKAQSQTISSAIHVASYINFDAIDIDVSQCQTVKRATIFLSSINKLGTSNFTNFLCQGNTASQGACLIFKSSSVLYIKNLTVKECKGNNILDFVSITQLIVNIEGFGASFNSFDNIIKASQAKIRITDFLSRNNQASDDFLSMESTDLYLTNSGFVISSYKGPQSAITIINLLKSNATILNATAGVSHDAELSILFLSLSESSTTLKQVALNGLGDLTSQMGIIYAINSNLVINKLDLSNNKGYGLELQSSDLMLAESIFRNNDFTKGHELSFISESISNDISIISTAFLRNHSGVALNFFSIARLVLYDVFLKGSQISSSGINIQNIGSLSINNSAFDSLNSSLEGGCIRVIGQGLPIKLISVNNTNFTNNSAPNGGAFYIEGNLTINISNSKFHNNLAYNTTDSSEFKFYSGVGACGIFICDKANGENCRAFLKNNEFFNNFADNFSSLFFSVDQLDTESSLASNNSDSTLFAKDSFSSRPLFLNIIEEDTFFGAKSIQFKYQPENLMTSVTSGQVFNLTVALTDSEGNILKFDSGSTASLSPPEDMTELQMEKYLAFSEKGFIKFRDVILKTSLLKNINLSFALSQSTPIFHQLRSAVTSTDGAEYHLAISRNITILPKKCQIGTIRTLDSACVPCSAGTYSLIDPMNDAEKLQTCRLCPENANCPGLNSIIPDSGFWRAHENSSSIIRCPLSKACLGGSKVNSSKEENSTGACAEGHYGNLCFDCDYSYGKFGKYSLCKSCSSDISLDLLRTAAVVFVVLVFIYVNVKVSTSLSQKSRNPNNAALISKIIVTHFHQLGIITFMENIWVFPSLNSFINLQNYISFLDQDFISIECMLSNSNYDKKTTYVYKVVSSILLPVIFSFFLLVVWLVILIALMLLRKDRRRTLVISFIKKVLVSFTVSIYLFYPLIIQSCFSLLNCISLDDSESNFSFLYAAPNMQCWTDKHQRYLLSLIIPGIVVFTIIFPATLFYILRASHKFKGGEAQIEPAERVRPQEYSLRKELFHVIVEEEIFRFFYEGYKARFFYWELIVFFKKFLLTMFSSMNQILSSKTKNILVLLFLLLNFSMNFECFPYRDKQINVLEIASISTTFITTVLIVLMGSLEYENLRNVSATSVIVVNTIFMFLVLKEICKIMIKWKKSRKIVFDNNLRVENMVKPRVENPAN